MQKDVKKYIQSLMVSGAHRHESMTDTMKCDTCGVNFKKAEFEYNRLRRQKPELFTRKTPDEPMTSELGNQWAQLEDRLKKDKLYRKHVEILAHGTFEEKKRESERMNSGFYR